MRPPESTWLFKTTGHPIAWAAARFDHAPGGPSTWDPEHVEYAFTASGMSASGEAVLEDADPAVLTPDVGGTGTTETLGRAVAERLAG